MSIRELAVYKISAFSAKNVPESLKSNQYLRYAYSRLFFGKIPNEKNAIILYTQTKSGTYYFNFLMASYLLAEFENDYSSLDFSKMAMDVFGNTLSNVRNYEEAYKKPHKLFDKIQYGDFVFGHLDVGIEYSPARIIGIYRNPLDNLVSNYYYRYINRESVTDKPNSVDDILDDWLPYLIKTYTLMDKLSGKKNALVFSYEELTRYPHLCIATVVRWLGLRLDYSNVDHAVQNSSFEKVRSFETRESRLSSESTNFTGKFFTRSGKIGEWRNEMSPEAVNKVKTALEDAGINFSRFIIE